ncbi:H-2 class I histocompatibility antigen, K-K alpha chain-like [Ascaphus truei]|uniref:H-2 class I histocompatibility antigen, K-K alpha chain-like n=1 Tax=Ascaphus truei TaxID=8439 RepID=UPI003F591038
MRVRERGPQCVPYTSTMLCPLLLLLTLGVSGGYSDSHSLRYYYTAVSAPGSGLPLFTSVGYVDDREIMRYDSDSRQERPVAPWMQKIEDPDYWERNTQKTKGHEPVYKHNVQAVMRRYNQTGGFHSFQEMYGCELRDDGSARGYNQLGYDGKEFLSLDTERWTYVSTAPEAQITTQRWNSAEVNMPQRYRELPGT